MILDTRKLGKLLPEPGWLLCNLRSFVILHYCSTVKLLSEEKKSTDFSVSLANQPLQDSVNLYERSSLRLENYPYSLFRLEIAKKPLRSPESATLKRHRALMLLTGEERK